MAKGAKIVVSGEPKGKFIEGIMDTAEYPGTIVQMDFSQAQVGNRFHFVVYNADADGGRPKGPFIVLLADMLQGKLATTAYTAGNQGFGYVPLPGDELNLLWADTDTGTSTNDIAIGTVGIVDDGTGKIIATAASPETEVCILAEALDNISGDTLGWVYWTGY